MMLTCASFTSLLVGCTAAGRDVAVGVFAAPGVMGRTWSKTAPGGCGSAKGRALHVCNLKAYTAAVETAAAEGVELLLFPESYSLGDFTPQERYYEPLAEDANGTMPCQAKDTAIVAQTTMSCAAKDHGVAVAVNLMTQLANGTKHITELVFDTNGVITSVYHKQLFPAENLWAEPGPLAPTSFELFGQRWGVVVCWEGLKPFISRDFSQFEGLVAQGASVILWPVAASVELILTAQARAARRFGVKVVATGGSGRLGPHAFPAFTDETGTTVKSADVPISGLNELGFNVEAFVRKATLHFGHSVV